MQTKRHKTLTTQDQISALPDSILLDILSSLPTKDAIKTGVLSKRWTSLWTSVPSLSFSDDSFANYDVFATAVDATLAQHTAPKLTKFFVKFKDLKKFIQIYVLPQHLYANEFVSELDIFSCYIMPNGLIRWSSLKRLNIRSSPLGDDALKKMLMGSPSLEYLEFSTCFRPSRLDINKGFTMGRMVRSSRKIIHVPVFVLEMEIVAPKLESFEIVGNFKRLKCRMKYMEALGMNLERRMLVRCIKTLKQFLESMHHDKELTRGRWCLKVPSIMSLKHLPSPLSKCKSLTMKAGMDKWDLPGKSASKFTICGNVGYRHRILPPPNLRVSHWKSTETCFNSLLLCLLTIKIFGFEKRLFHIKEVFILVVRFLLKNAKVLEKMVISEPRFMKYQTGDMLNEILQVTQKLLNFFRSSPHAMVMFTSFPYQKNDL
ncbi:hypothetical protein ACB092_01G130300 [Castanea dentata]